MSDNKNENKVQIANDIAGSQVCHGAIINISDFDVTLDFVFVSPLSKKANVISRITMPSIIAEQFSANLSSAIAKQKESKNA